MMKLKEADRYPDVPWLDRNGLIYYWGATVNFGTIRYFMLDRDGPGLTLKAV